MVYTMIYFLYKDQLTAELSYNAVRIFLTNSFMIPIEFSGLCEVNDTFNG